MKGGKEVEKEGKSQAHRLRLIYENILVWGTVGPEWSPGVDLPLPGRLALGNDSQDGSSLGGGDEVT